MRSPPTSPPATKRARLDPDESFTTLPPSSSSTPVKVNGYTNGHDAAPIVTTAPLPPGAEKSAIDPESSDEEEEEVVKEEEDLSRRDMYLDTVSNLAKRRS